MSDHLAFRLRLRNAPPVSLEFAGVSPVLLSGRSVSDASRQPLWHGNRRVELGEFFDLEPLPRDAPELLLEGDLRRVHGVGRGLAEGLIHVDGDAGDYLGAEMLGGQLTVSGSVGALAACAMAGGSIEIGGNAGNFAASALPGDMDGMRGGELVIHGNAGARCGDRMRRGTLVVHGDAGDFLASRMVAGTIALGGAAGAHCGYGMRRGSIVFAGAEPGVPATFAPTGHDIGVFWALLARSLSAQGGVFERLPACRPRRLTGDLSVDGMGEWLLPG